MRLFTTVLLLCLLPTAVVADLVITGPDKIGPYKIVKVTATEEAATPKAQWVWKVTGVGADGKAVTPDIGWKKNGVCHFVGPPGTYTVSLTLVDFDAKLFEQGEFTVVISGDGPPPPGPGPGPGPSPTDPLNKIVADAYAMDTDTGKAALKKSLAGVYRNASAAAYLAKAATWGDLFKQMSADAQAAGVSGKLPNTQKAIQTELQSKLPASPTLTMDAAARTLAATTFTRVALALDNTRRK